MVAPAELTIKYLEPEDAEALAEFFVRNREHLASTSPNRPESFFTVAFHTEDLLRNLAERKADRRYVFGIWRGDLLVGRIALNEIVRGAYQNAFIGYMLDKEYLCRGYMTYAVRQVLNHAFTELNLHRIEASVLPTNLASQRVVEKCGFTRFGLAKRHLNIAGEWRDHIIYYLTVEDFAG